MKKIFTLAAIALFMMTSCSDDDSSSNNNNNTDTVLLKKMIETNEEGTYTSTFSYNGTKLVKITNSDGTYETYSYDIGGGVTTDLIQESKYYDSDGTLLDESEYLYNMQNQLIVFTYTNREDGDIYISRVEYTHNSDGTIIWKDFGNTSSPIETGKIYPNKFDINMEANDGDPAYVNSTTFTYDNKNNPLKNITGFDKISFAGSDEGTTFLHNITSEVHSTTLGLTEDISHTTYVYNSDNYPVSSVMIEDYNNDAETTTQYFYE